MKSAGNCGLALAAQYLFLFPKPHLHLLLSAEVIDLQLAIAPPKMQAAGLLLPRIYDQTHEKRAAYGEAPPWRWEGIYPFLGSQNAAMARRTVGA